MLSEAYNLALGGYFAKYLGAIPIDRFSNTIFDDLGLDSLQATAICGDIARDFGVIIPPDTLILSTLELVRQHVGAESAQIYDRKTLPSEKAVDSQLLNDVPRKLFSLIAAAADTEVEDVHEWHTLRQLNLDAFAILQLREDIKHTFPRETGLRHMSMSTTVKEIVQLVRPQYKPNSTSSNGIPTTPSTGTSQCAFACQDTLTALTRADINFATAAKKRGFSGYWTDVAPLFDKLLLTYIIEGFTALGVNLTEVPSGTVIAEVRHIPKYDRLLGRLWDFLKRQDIVVRAKNLNIRSNSPLEVQPAKQLNASLKRHFPYYSPETDLLGLVGPQLAACIIGDADPVAIMFGNMESLRIMQDFYTNSPMMSTLTDQLLDFLTILLRGTKSNAGGTVRILEVGAGTGGTTARLAEALDGLGTAIQYTFTDLSPAFVSQAKRKFSKYSWMDFSVFNLEKEVNENFKNQYDIVIGANVVHATSDRTAACRRLKETLRIGGFIVLSEITRPISWYDICFGLLDGWWLAEGGKGYPIQSAEAWMSTFRRAGFDSMGYSTGESLEANSQQLLVGCTTA